jgi:hypothetical protein
MELPAGETFDRLQRFGRAFVGLVPDNCPDQFAGIRARDYHARHGGDLISRGEAESAGLRKKSLAEES